MALIGHVTSTAISGGDSPVFEKAGVDVVLEVSKQTDAVQEQLAAQAKQIDSLTAALTAFLNAHAPAAPVEAPVELTPAEKAAATKAANKAKAEAEAAKEAE